MLLISANSSLDLIVDVKVLETVCQLSHLFFFLFILDVISNIHIFMQHSHEPMSGNIACHTACFISTISS